MNCPKCNALMGIVGPELLQAFHCPKCGHVVLIESEEREMTKKKVIETREMTKRIKVEVLEKIYRSTVDVINPISVDVLSWESKPPKLNIRRMFKDNKTNELVFGKGVSLSEPEILAVHKALGKYIEKHKISKTFEEGKK